MTCSRYEPLRKAMSFQTLPMGFTQLSKNCGSGVNDGVWLCDSLLSKLILVYHYQCYTNSRRLFLMGLFEIKAGVSYPSSQPPRGRSTRMGGSTE